MLSFNGRSANSLLKCLNVLVTPNSAALLVIQTFSSSAYLRYCPRFLEIDELLPGASHSQITKSFTSLFAEEIAADGIQSDKGPSGLGRTVTFLKYFNNAIIALSHPRGTRCQPIRVTLHVTNETMEFLIFNEINFLLF